MLDQPQSPMTGGKSSEAILSLLRTQMEFRDSTVTM